MTGAIRPWTLHVEEAQLEDLHRRLQWTRWPDPEPVSDWSQGAPLAKVQALVEYTFRRYGADRQHTHPALHGFGAARRAPGVVAVSRRSSPGSA